MEKVIFDVGYKCIIHFSTFSAKLGLVGFSQTLAKKGAKYNITANAVAPTAGSRLLATVSTEGMNIILSGILLVAKLGLVGFSQTLAKEGAKYNISANAVAPTAGSRMLATVSTDGRSTTGSSEV